jgi:hypothetical protein
MHFTNLKSNHINHIIKHFEDNDRHFILLEAEEGLPLHKLIQMVGKFHDVFCSMLVTQVAWILK